MKRYILSIWFLICFSFSSHSQKEANIWYFSQSGLDFNYKPARVLTNSKINGFEGTASISDTLGGLLFYSDGDTVWNRFHEIIQGGMGIGGYHSYSCPSAPLIVRLPNSYRYYYIFTATQRNPPALEADEVSYSIIDLEQNGGRGRVISQRNVLVKNSAEKIAAVLHGNKRDVWIAVKQNRTDTLFVFKLTPNGLSSTIIKNRAYSDSFMTGQMKFSPNGKYLALGNVGAPNKKSRIVYLYNFDRYSGALDGERKIMVESNGVEFSPNSRYLYLSNIYQIPIDKISKVFYLDSSMYIGKNQQSYAMQLAPDGKLYIGTNDSFLHVVEYPNLEGKKCGFKYKEQVMYVKNIPFNSISIPVFLASYFQSEAFNVVKTCIGKPVNFIISDNYEIDSVYWDFGDTVSGSSNYSEIKGDVTHQYSKYGVFYPRLIIFWAGVADTFIQKISFTDPRPNFEADNACENDTIRFKNTSSKSAGLLQFNWRFGDGFTSGIESPNHFYYIKGVSGSFNVRLRVTMPDDCSDSIIKQVTVNANPNSDFSYVTNKDTVNFKATQIDNTTYKWIFGNGDSATGSKEMSYTYPINGKYDACLEAINAANCVSKTCKVVLITVGISNIYKQNRIKIYPNPNSGNFELEIDKLDKYSSIIIYDMMGHQIKTTMVNPNITTYTIKMDNLANGIYLVKLENDYSTEFKKIVLYR